MSEIVASQGGPHEVLRKVGRVLYTFRGYIPVPAVIAVVLWARPTPLSFLVGLVVAALGEVGRLWPLTYIGPKSRAEGKRRADRLIMEGPYSLTRNPLYVANLTIAAGVLLASNRWILLLAVPLGFVYYTLVILAEEEFLHAEYGQAFEEFRRSVPRFIPRLRRPTPAEVRFGILTCITPEMSTIIAAEVALGLIGLKLFAALDFLSGIHGNTAFLLFP
ncbi:MAG: methyltransferase family protein [Planctomycetota bacterium]|jgi:protein-S-isoprenylcysteine O-methyltransferase Ste14